MHDVKAGELKPTVEAPTTTGVPSSGAPAASEQTTDAHWTPQRLRLHSWLRAEAPALAPVYEAIVRMAVDSAFPGRVWFVAHGLRDIRNRLPNAIAGPVKGSKTEYSNLAATVTSCWIEDGLSGDGSSPLAGGSEPSSEGPERIEVSAALFAAVGALVAGHLAIGPRKEEGARRLFAAVAGQPVPDYVVRAWIQATNRAETFAHLRDKALTPEQERSFDEIFLACERALMAMANRSYENMDALDEILESANS